ncbi:AIPR family protein [Methylobacterium sp. UNC378MF]|uniref:AIPR family protein n=1 Tax=Methylobacterium sp. UNC378MF TaxID=1502748 RepID=UPI0015877BEB|nr:AIPR family protein [Methylobacterium sp. UNC378MF]
MAIDVDYPALLENFREHMAPKRSESASFLIWYLEQYYRLEDVEAVDAVCDQPGDKGVDGIFINDNNQTITIFQSKVSHRSDTALGDFALRNFLGTLRQFQSVETAEHLMKTAGMAQVAQLIKRSGLLEKLPSYELHGEFVANIDLDRNGADFLDRHNKEIAFVGKKELLANYISDERDLPKQKIVTFDVFGVKCAEHIAGTGTKAVIAPIRARELVELDGIEDQSLFTYNVRGPLGRTSVNKDLVKSVKDSSTHRNFPLFHNGITVIAKHLKMDEEKIEIGGYYVVNGCQSVTSLHGNKSAITDDLKLLTKFIQMDPTSDEAKQITEYSNNQNGVRSRDFKSNNAIQIRLRTEFAQHYKDRYIFEIKRGETSAAGEPISNEEAGLYLMAFDLKEPWGTHRKYEVFEDKHSALFGRPYVTADRIVMLRVIDDEIKAQLIKFKEPLLAQYKLTRYMLMYILREMLSEDTKFKEIIDYPELYVRDLKLSNAFRRAISIFISDIIVDINEESKSFGEDFDYRGKIKDADWVREITKTIQKGYHKNVNRGRQDSFEMEWSKCVKHQEAN